MDTNEQTVYVTSDFVFENSQEMNEYEFTVPYIYYDNNKYNPLHTKYKFSNIKEFCGVENNRYSYNITYSKDATTQPYIDFCDKINNDDTLIYGSNTNIFAYSITKWYNHDNSIWSNITTHNGQYHRDYLQNVLGDYQPFNEILNIDTSSISYCLSKDDLHEGRMHHNYTMPENNSTLSFIRLALADDVEDFNLNGYQFAKKLVMTDSITLSQELYLTVRYMALHPTINNAIELYNQNKNNMYATLYVDADNPNLTTQNLTLEVDNNRFALTAPKQSPILYFAKDNGEKYFDNYGSVNEDNTLTICYNYFDTHNLPIDINRRIISGNTYYHGNSGGHDTNITEFVTKLYAKYTIM